MRGLYIDNYSAFKSRIPGTHTGYPLGVVTFAEEMSEWQKRESAIVIRKPEFSGCTMLIWKVRMAINNPNIGIFANWILQEIYKRSFPDIPLESNTPPWAIADILVAIDGEGTLGLQRALAEQVGVFHKAIIAMERIPSLQNQELA